MCDDQSQRAVHYVYVKETFRRQGVGRQLAGWIDDGSKGTVALMAYPPPWFTMGSRDGTTKPLWRSHQIVDTITPV